MTNSFDDGNRVKLLKKAMAHKNYKTRYGNKTKIDVFW
jgi:hypothetical protein